MHNVNFSRLGKKIGNKRAKAVKAGKKVKYIIFNTHYCVNLFADFFSQIIDDSFFSK